MESSSRRGFLVVVEAYIPAATGLPLMDSSGGHVNVCGIIGITQEPELGNVVPLLLKGLERLEYRGYDSVGVAVIGPGGVVVRKAAGKLADVRRRLALDELHGFNGIGHTRWATHGPPNDVNAHPHSDCTGRVILVHNGVVRNYASLKKRIETRGHRLQSETDTEVVAHLIEEKLREGASSFIDAFARALLEVEGSYALALLYTPEPDRIYFARMRSPLILGVGEGRNAVASDIPALLDFTRKIIVIEDDEFGWITPREVRLFKLDRSRGVYYEIPQERVASRVKVVEWTPEAASKAGYPHYMLKEIFEQPQAVRDTLNGVLEDPGVAIAADAIAGARRVFVVGAGTSYHAGLVFVYFLARLAGMAAIPVVSSEYKVYQASVGEGDVVVAVSQSGETYDTLEAVRHYKERGAKIVGVTNVLGSALDRESEFTVYTRAGPEIGVAATKTYVSQVMALTVLATRVGIASGGLGESDARRVLSILEEAPRVIADSIQVGDAYARALARVLDRGSVYILGRGLGAFLAKEAALKVKEIAYLHAEAYPAGESKHGPIALVEEKFPVFILATSDSPEVAGNALEMAARGASVHVFRPADLHLELGEGVATIFDMPPSGGNLVLEPFILIPPFQLLAYRIAVKKGYDPDKPRNLAKTVTVE